MNRRQCPCCHNETSLMRDHSMRWTLSKTAKSWLWSLRATISSNTGGCSLSEDGARTSEFNKQFKLKVEMSRDNLGG